MPLQGPWIPKVYAMRPLWYGAPLPVITLCAMVHVCIYLPYSTLVLRFETPFTCNSAWLAIGKHGTSQG